MNKVLIFCCMATIIIFDAKSELKEKRDKIYDHTVLPAVEGEKKVKEAAPRGVENGKTREELAIDDAKAYLKEAEKEAKRRHDRKEIYDKTFLPVVVGAKKVKETAARGVQNVKKRVELVAEDTKSYDTKAKRRQFRKELYDKRVLFVVERAKKVKEATARGVEDIKKRVKHAVEDAKAYHEKAKRRRVAKQVTVTSTPRTVTKVHVAKFNSEAEKKAAKKKQNK